MLQRLLAKLRRPVPSAPAPAAPDYVADRETDRVGHLSAEDRAWEAASQQRSREQRDRAGGAERGA
jgi:hypothetical protein